MGGFVQGIVNGYGGVRYKHDSMALTPNLPPNTTALTISGVHFRGASLTLRIVATHAEVVLVRAPAAPRAASLQYVSARDGTRASSQLRLNETVEVKLGSLAAVKVKTDDTQWRSGSATSFQASGGALSGVIFIPFFVVILLLLYVAALNSLWLLHPGPLAEWSAGTMAEAGALHVFLVLGVWSYAGTCLTPPGFADDDYVQKWMRDVRWRTTGGRYCSQCDAPKPARVHHCRHSGRCVLRLDHFCIFANTPIGAANHKHFLLWQLYQSLAAAEMARLCFCGLAVAVDQTQQRSSSGLSGAAARKARGDAVGQLVLLVLGLIVSLFTFAAPAFYLPGHVRRAMSNISAVEAAQGSSKEFDCGGRLRNLERVLGRRWLWLLPLGAPGLRTVLPLQTHKNHL